LGSGYTKSKSKSIALLIIVLFSLASMLFAFGFMFFELGKVLDQVGMIDTLLSFVLFYASAFTALYILLRADGFLFHFRDYELIAPLPVKPLEIIITKVVLMMTMLYAMIFFVTSPIIVVYIIFQGFSLITLVMYIIGVLAIPLLPTIVFSLVAILIQGMTRFFRNNKLMSIILMMGFFVVFMGVYFSALFSNDGNLFLNQANMMAWIGEHYFVAKWFVLAVHEHSISALLGLVAIGVVPFLMFFFAIPKIIIRLNENSRNVHVKTNLKVEYTSRTLYPTLIRKEANRFFSVPIYALNSGIGIVMLLLASGAALVFRGDVIQFLNMPELTGVRIELVAIGFIGFCIAMVYTPAVSLSLEGKSFWIVKSLPIPPKTLMRSKVLFNLILQIPVGIVSAIALGIAFAFSIWTTLALVFFVISLSLFISFAFSIINLWFPKFDYINETEVVKQSLAAMVAIFGSFAVLALAIYGLIQIATIVSFPLALAGISIIFSILAYLADRVIASISESLFRKMMA
jgi:ABC-2 type transport system permease protein